MSKRNATRRKHHAGKAKNYIDVVAEREDGSRVLFVVDDPRKVRKVLKTQQEEFAVLRTTDRHGRGKVLA